MQKHKYVLVLSWFPYWIKVFSAQMATALALIHLHNYHKNNDIVE